MRGFTKGSIGKILTVASIEQKVTNSNWKKCRFRKQIGRKWLRNMVVDDWNRLSQKIVSGKTIGSFKRKIYGFMNGDERWM